MMRNRIALIFYFATFLLLAVGCALTYCRAHEAAGVCLLVSIAFLVAYVAIYRPVTTT